MDLLRLHTEMNKGNSREAGLSGERDGRGGGQGRIWETNN